MTDRLLIVFTKNLVPGNVKTRLAKSLGDQLALKVYEFLLNHTQSVIQQLDMTVWVGYSDYVDDGDIWNDSVGLKFVQNGSDLGERMNNAFKKGFNQGFKKIVLIGGDCYDLQKSHLVTAFDMLETHDVTIGPAVDGGYYLIGLTKTIEEIFKNKIWGASSVLEQTLEDLEDEDVFLLEALNDIDTYDDFINHPVLARQLKNLL